jgi:hypothetical protein
MPACTATTAKGQPCKARVMRGRTVCKAHTGDPDIGQRTALTRQVHDQIIRALSAGSYAEDAARAAGVSPTSYFAWMERGEADRESGTDTPFAQFAEAATRAKSEARVAAVAYIRRAMPDDWRAAAWYLERTRPQEWGRRDRVDHTARVTQATVEVPADEDRLAEVARILRDAGALPGPA